uniref:Uncharacterized protein n=1 Tax=viral metagenome TaxID=1070528 RepID=A0A6C0ICZ3_9ZZZZ
MSKFMADDDDEKNDPIMDNDEEDDDDDVPVKTKRVMMSGAEDDDADEDLDEDQDDDQDEDIDDDLDDDDDTGMIGGPNSTTVSAPPGMNFAFNIDDDDDDEEEDEEEDEHYLQKFKENQKKDIISEYYPEMQVHNNDEIEIMCKVVRDKNGLIIDPLHKSLPFVTKYEKARILGERARQINAGAKPMVDVDENVIDGYLIALKEFQEKKIPFILKRPISGNHVEYWKLADLEIIF